MNMNYYYFHSFYPILNTWNILLSSIIIMTRVFKDIFPLIIIILLSHKLFLSCSQLQPWHFFSFQSLAEADQEGEGGEFSVRSPVWSRRGALRLTVTFDLPCFPGCHVAPDAPEAAQRRSLHHRQRAAARHVERARLPEGRRGNSAPGHWEGGVVQGEGPEPRWASFQCKFTNSDATVTLKK